MRPIKFSFKINSKLSRREKNLLLLLFIVLIFYIIMNIFMPLLQNYRQKQEKLMSLREEYKKMVDYYNGLMREKKYMGEYKKKREEVLSILPDNGNLENIIESIDLLSSKNNVKILMIKPEGENTGEKGEKYVSFFIQIEGSKKDLYSFISDFENQKRLTFIDSFVINFNNENIGSVELKVRYVYY